MLSNHKSLHFFKLCRQYPDKLGWLLSPKNWARPRDFIQFALDNDAYTQWLNNEPFDLVTWDELLSKVRACGFKPLWVAVPDFVANREETLRRWKQYSPVAKIYGWPLAFVVQDGMTPRDIPRDADLIFIGGTTQWKWRTLPTWTAAFPRVHVGRVRTRMLIRCEELGAESVDGTGWFRESITGRPFRQLEAWLMEANVQTNLL
jgi:hypothetical protein